MSRDQAANALFGVAITFVIIALLTLIPFSAAKMNDLGYHSICPFAPWSTLALLFVALVAWMVRGYVLTRA
ncbi:MAG TPA: hypothetical protein VMG40_13325 [Bryobacteraceae bacterium]|nr:hypothetical protein [Bryobacteraceae bacterium]